MSQIEIRYCGIQVELSSVLLSLMTHRTRALELQARLFVCVGPGLAWPDS